MNNNQKIVLCIGIIAFILVGLFPPWMFVRSTNQIYMSLGYHYFLNPPKIDQQTPLNSVLTQINFPRLWSQWVMVVVVTGGLIALLKDKKTN